MFNHIESVTMKKRYIIFTLSGLLILMNLKAQISIDNAYGGLARSANLEVKGSIYYSIDPVNNKCILYNSDHSLWKTIDIEVPLNNSIYDIQYVSQHLFNGDELIEMTVEFYEYKVDQNSVGYYEFTTKVIGEDGSELLVVAGGAYPTVFKIDSDAAKLAIYLYDYSLSLYALGTNIYSIPGVPSGQQEKERNGLLQYLGEPYPNPVNSHVMIPFTLPPDLKFAYLVVTDINGKEITQVRIDQNTGKLRLDVNSFPAGTYFYRIRSGSFRTDTETFIVN